jgi:hypothetical protein
LCLARGGTAMTTADPTGDSTADAAGSELQDTGAVLARLAENEYAFVSAAEAFANGDADRMRAVLEQVGLFERCWLLCRWLCGWYCTWRCHVLGIQLPTREHTLPELQEFAARVARLAADERQAAAMVDAIETGDREHFARVVGAFELERFGFLLCQLVCVLRCRVFCQWTCLPGPRRAELVGLFRKSAKALEALAADRKVFEAVHEAADRDDVAAIQSVLGEIQLRRFCLVLCLWLCTWRCLRVCVRLCGPTVEWVPGPRELREYALGVTKLVSGSEPGPRLLEVVSRGEREPWDELLEEFRLVQFCHPLCWWVCHLRCERFCLLLCPPLHPVPVFRKIGVYNYLAEIDSSGAGTGLTLADKRAFHGGMRLNGTLHKQLNGQPMQYRFEVMELPGGSWKPVLPHQIARTIIGAWTQNNPNPAEDDFFKDYTVNGTNTFQEVTVVPDADGWIAVPQENDFWGPAGLFTPNGNMIVLRSETLNPDPDLNLSGIVAGQSTAPAGLGQDQLFAIRMRVREVGNPGSEIGAGTCPRVAVFNRRYDQVAKGGTWAPTMVDDHLAAALLNIDEIAGGCGKVTNTLTVRYTAAHPNLGAITLWMTGPGGPYSFTMTDGPGATPGNRFGSATPTVNVAPLPQCAYLVKLRVDVLLTTGDVHPDPVWDEVAFCK